LTQNPTRGTARSEWRVDRRDSIDSTNEEARRRALAGDPGRLWVIAGEQTAGRGRRGRSWVSPTGNLHASALLIDPCPQPLSPQLGFVAGVALAGAAEDLGAAQAKLKWPNDLVIDGAKCAGLLVEGAALPGGGFACVVGVGVNCAHAPEGVGYPTARLSAADGSRIETESCFARLAARFESALDTWAAGEGFAAIRAEWLSRAAGLGTVVRIGNGEALREGVFEGLDADGRLLFRGSRGTETVEAADLLIRPKEEPRPDRLRVSLGEGRPHD